MHEATLKVHVESIVGPVHAPEYLKNRFRGELYAHAFDLYRQYAKTVRNTEESIAAVFDALGNAQSLRAEFLNSIPRIERWSFTLESGYGRARVRAFIPLALILWIPAAIMLFGLNVLLTLHKGSEPLEVLVINSLIFADFMLVLYVVISYLWLLAPFRKALLVHPPKWRMLLALAVAHVLSTAAAAMVLCIGLRIELYLLHLPTLGAGWVLTHAAPILMTFSASTMLLVIYYIEIRSRRKTERSLLDTDGHIPDWPYEG